MDLSKVFNCIPHDIIKAKLHAYEFHVVSLRFMHRCLTGRYPRDKITSSYSLWSVVKNWVPQVQFWVP